MSLGSTTSTKQGDDSGYSVELFWAANKTELPHWFIVRRSLALIQPSSAMIERAFLNLRVAVSDNQHFALFKRRHD